MKTDRVQDTIRLPRHIVEELDRICARDNLKRGVLMRQIIEQAIADSHPVKIDKVRCAQLLEYTQVGIELLLQTVAPQHRDKVMPTTLKRMEDYHAK